MRFLAPLVLASLLLAGCAGIPAGSAEFGDTITVRYTAVDPVTGEPVAWRLKQVQTQNVDGIDMYNGASLRSVIEQRLGTPLPSDVEDLLNNQDGQTRAMIGKTEVVDFFTDHPLVREFWVEATFEMGTGNSGLGVKVERALRGAFANDTFTLTTRDDPTRGYFLTETAERMLGPNEIRRTVSQQEFAQFGAQAIVGATFPFGLFQAQVTNVTNNQVSFEVMVTGSETTDVPAVGARVEVDVEGDVWWYRLEPVQGATFQIQPPSFFQPSTPLGLEPGLYQTSGKDGDLLVYKRYPGNDADLVGVPLTIHIEVIDVQQRESKPVDGNWTRRDAGALRGGTQVAGVSFEPHTSATATHEEHDDGHHDDGHTH